MGIGAGTGAIIGGVTSAAGSLLGGSKAASGSGQSAYLQALEFNQNAVYSQPFIQAGQGATGALQGMVYGAPGYDLSQIPLASAAPTFSWNPTMEGLAQTPGYQFTLQQGLMATQNAAAAQGLGVSGAALKGAANYATGLASTTYNQQLQNALNQYSAQLSGYTTSAAQAQNQFNDYWANQSNRYNQLMGIAQLGANVATQTGQTQATAASSVGNALTNQATTQGASYQAAANSLGTALSSPQGSQAVQSAGNWLTNLFTGGGSTVTNQGGASGAGTSDASNAAWQAYLQGY